MSNPFEEYAELAGLIELLVEDRISAVDFARLQMIVRESRDARAFYRRYLDLHGMLHWDAAQSSVDDVASGVSLTVGLATASATESQRRRFDHSRTRRWIAGAIAVACAGIVIVLMAGPFRRDSGSGFPGTELAVRTDSPDQPKAGEIKPPTDLRNSNTTEITQKDHRIATTANDPMKTETVAPVRLPELPEATPETANIEGTAAASVVRPRDDAAVRPVDSSIVNASPASGSGSSAAVVAFVNERLNESWTENAVTPSPKADDSEWLRRVSIDIIGHIPTSAQVVAFLDDRRVDKRERLIDQLLDDEDYVRNWTTIWTNLLIGRSNPRHVNRASLQAFLRDAFGRNRGWNEVVTDFVSAEGSGEENGAANFLLAHLNNQAVPATAIAGRLFLGQQLQCTQCHNHPFNDQRQDEFWSFNSFFQQVETVERPRRGSSRVMDVALVDRKESGPTFYETRNGLQMATFPRYEDVRVDVDAEPRLRPVLARLLTSGESPQIARAFVNRMWHHFFGAAFTPVVDDMGPHAPISHPEVLDRLTREFVRSGYDVRQLIRWICSTEAYGLTSRMADGNQVDDPVTGNEALFSRVYVKPMTVEQVFDSLLIATNARELFGPDWDTVEKKRQQWLQQFVIAWDTDDNDEADLFDGSIPQALMLMNGELVKTSLDANRGTALDRITRSSSTEPEKIQQIALAALSRRLTPQELAASRRLIHESVAHRPRNVDAGAAMKSGLEDFFWACLNSNEFILVH